jgi:hypothetical protein
VNCHQALLATLYRKIAALSKGKKKRTKPENFSYRHLCKNALINFGPIRLAESIVR